MNIGDKIFLLYTDRKTRDTSCEGPAIISSFIIDPHNDEGIIVIKKPNGSSCMVDLEGTSSHEVDIHLVY
jgi:hypothetical protein